MAVPDSAASMASEEPARAGEPVDAPHLGQRHVHAHQAHAGVHRPGVPRVRVLGATPEVAVAVAVVQSLANARDQGVAVLEDDRRAIPPYDAIILARPDLARDQPRVVAALGALAGTIDAAAMRRMNAAVDQEGQSPAAVARAFLDGRAERAQP